jgi:hypothetical protein
MPPLKKFAPYVVLLVMLVVAAGYAVGKKQAFRDNARDAAPAAAAEG